jgi:glycosyltransferase involved in cell wall biosynthesis
VELAVLALEELARRNVRFHADFFGAPLEPERAPFPYTDHGVITPAELATLFRECDLGIVFSATNYSLVPQDMMACGLPVVELRGENTECIFPDGVATLVEPDPHAIATGIAALLADPAAREKQAAVARAWVRQFGWSDSARMVESALRERLSKFAQAASDAGGTDPKTKVSPRLKASVVIPTLNAGPVFEKVLGAVTAQSAPWPYEILVIDSGSTDGTRELVQRFPTVRLHTIEKAEFDHGETRNLGVRLTSGEFVAFLTQDAMPTGPDWLFNLVAASEQFGEKAAGAFGRHLAWPDACPFTRRDTDAHFSRLGDYPLYLDKSTDAKRYRKDEAWRQFLHFFSDNNSCLRRSAWEKIPFRKTKYGEDQLWARDILDAGLGKVYAARAVVYHSHDFGEEQTFERSKTEGAYFRHFFGYTLMNNKKALASTLEKLNRHDEQWGVEHNISAEVIAARKRLNEARLKGWLEGAHLETRGLF